MAARKREVVAVPPTDFADAIAKSAEAQRVEPDDIRTTPFTAWVERHGQRLEPGQRALCRVLFDRLDPSDLDGDERDRAMRMFGCARVPDAARKLGILLAVCGGRGGKSLLAAWRLVYLAATLPLVLSPGEQAFAIIVAPDQRLAEQTLRYCIGIAQAWFPEKGRVSEESSLGFTLVRAKSDGDGDGKWADERVRFAILPASKGGSAQRGRALVGAILDEAAFFRGEDSVVNDRDVIDAITPRIIVGGEIIISTTPWARSGEVWELFNRNFGHPVDAVVAHAPTWELRTDDRILAQVDREKERDPWNYAREFGAQFLERDQGTFFESDCVEACIQGAA